MEENPEVAKGFSVNRIDVDRFWRDAAVKLNSHGPPSKDGATWKKVWADFKNKTKKKLVENETKRKQSGFNDNNLIPLSEFEEAIVRITSLSQSVSGIKAKVFGVNQTRIEEPDVAETASTSNNNISMTSINEDEEHLVEKQRSQRTKNDTPVQLLQKQNEVFEKFFADLCSKLDDMKYEFHRINRNLQRTEDRQKQIYEENRRHNLALENIMLQKLELKKKLIEMELEKLTEKLVDA
ncbi:uncharacterized protein LOC129940188 [Eupeodes corollae]|uniref:uncharacterized protein LOC129940188 n=1 Tax=Eupeodes corollae TaxID=290404 RepID=UPI00249275D6|nr:uncharacterized protein LOC129940188 [Eupeodes corollae]